MVFNTATSQYERQQVLFSSFPKILMILFFNQNFSQNLFEINILRMWSFES